MRKANNFCELSYNCANILIKVITAVHAILWDLIHFWKLNQLIANLSKQAEMGIEHHVLGASGVFRQTKD